MIVSGGGGQEKHNPTEGNHPITALFDSSFYRSDVLVDYCWSVFNFASLKHHHIYRPTPIV